MIKLIPMKKLFFLTLLVGCACLANAKMDYTAIDKAAYEAPVLENSSQLNSFVHRLIRPYKTDEEKARILLAWIVHNIDYDGYKATAIADELDRSKKKNRELFVPSNNILETRLGVCGDIAKLYEKMCKMAGLDAVSIEGKTRNDKTTLSTFEDGEGHMWNAVKINREWEYVDPTWAMGGENTKSLEKIEKKKEYEKIVKQREKRQSNSKLPRPNRVVKDEWFLTDKEEMIKTHFPNDPRWQLQKKEISKEEFLGLTDTKEYREARKELRKKRREQVR